MIRRFALALPLLFASLVVLPGCDDSGDDGAANTDDGNQLDPACYDDWGDKSAGMPSVMENGWGEGCSTDADCQAKLGGDAVCIIDVLGVYALPNGYCSIHCTLPDNETQYIPDSPQCSDEPGIDCIGAKGFFEACAPPCTDDSECTREGYSCTIFPQIGEDGHPKYCLMNADVCCLDPAQC
jgi:hypothetical protein